MTRKSFTGVAAAAAVAGLVAGAATTLVGCSKNDAVAPTAAGVTPATTPALHSCSGQNACKGQGGCSAGDGGCRGKNSCKGKGGCKTN